MLPTPWSWKKTKILPVHKKDDKQLIKKYEPISSLPVCGKVFEHLTFYAVSSQFQETTSILPINQIFFQEICVYSNIRLPIIHDILQP